MKNIQQLTGKDKETKQWIDIYPLAFVESIYNGATRERLDNILFHFNDIAVPFKGTIYKTRVSVRKQFRRKGLTITYFMTDGTLRIERYLSLVTDDEHWGDDKNWESANNRDIPAGSITSESLSPELLAYLEGVVGQKGDKGDKGDAGKAATIDAGSVTTLFPGDEAYVRNTGTETNAVFDFGIPRGENGKTPEIEVGDVTTLEPYEKADVTITGETLFPKLNFFLPRGHKGDYWFMVLNTNSIYIDYQGRCDPGELKAETRKISCDGTIEDVACYYQIDESDDGENFSTVYKSIRPERDMTPFELPSRDTAKKCYQIKAFLDEGFNEIVANEYIWRVKNGEPNTPEELMDLLRLYLYENLPNEILYANADGIIEGGGSYAEFETAINNELPDLLK